MQAAKEESSDDDDDVDRQGSWIRRRRLDGALNRFVNALNTLDNIEPFTLHSFSSRVPLGFYSDVWQILEKCPTLSMYGNELDNGLTQEVRASF